MKLSELYWHRITPLHFLLWPISVFYGFFLLLKELCYWLDIFPSVKLSVPVIMVDSITINDGGKTPLLLWLVDCLLVHGFSPGIITRGNYDNPGLPAAVTSTSDPHSVGGKTFLLAQHCEDLCPVWVGNDRAEVAQALLSTHPTCNVIICNDGMQYHRLERDIELTVVDFSKQSFGNGLLLPAGPLRRNLKFLGKSGIIVINGKQNHQTDTSKWGKTYNMKLINEIAYNVCNPESHQLVSDFRNKHVHAVADADNSRWFFDFIQKTGLNAELHAYAENHRFIQQEINFSGADIILMPEENALQCQAFADRKLWALPRKAWVNSELQAILLKQLRNNSALQNQQ